ncbi:DUF1330 domain-containing protein [Dictyobacter arantiisoli]|uniref:DUF1330 domain-containing protein n=1 Tax=Dictyobacter arantiisoli TaxID=2014874 RepID=A0A5A5TGG0_9CHLR|nr:DUF1330 domain-containing protein [Dictyobacter arantiisoli]GCF10671.1 hypothetical protein KDI_42350 [Dictyobacter arantiisoli]
MAAYLVFDVEKITDVEMMMEYRRLAAPTLKEYGVKFLVEGGGPYEVIEGERPTQGLVILQFEDTDHFRRWFNSSEYQEARKLRLRSSTAQVILIEGQ